MTKLVSVLGSTGSIGRQSLMIIKHLGLSVSSLAANRSTELLEEQVREFKPSLVAVFDEKAAADLKIRLRDTSVRIVSGMEGVIEAAADSSGTVITAMSGAAGLRPTMAAIEKGKRIALANKETLVCAGEIVMAAAGTHGAEIVPVDSEHSAIFQCLDGQKDTGFSRIILTASGGPFRGMSREELKNVRKEDALKHPNWSMGPKITIDSATLMNKGLEFIEAMHLFGASPDNIDVLIHPQSIVHSMVEFADGSVLAQCGVPDMKIPIQYALTYPERKPSIVPAPDFTKAPLTFFKPDLETFPCLKIAMESARLGGTAPAVMNAANEEAVRLFLNDKISFYGIYDAVVLALDSIKNKASPTLEDILEADRQARELVRKA
ncbi:MAG TPA: 1-deoxy-D-xylulose-5-phosphate reductoisomerase [Clostridiales bacterium]|jgi:1-deoxy-D-xylulose-5-phosphate reductoisomerase|nr:1-deoxy-D-xylulose-5-phosphate reductoisomerase [Clostridiales bacterium]